MGFIGDITFQGAYGDIDLTITSINTDEGRDIAIQSPARGSRHFLQDRGRRIGKVECEIVFVEEPGKPSYLKRFDAFRVLALSGEPQLFTHPLTGSFRARAEAMPHTASADAKEIRVTCTFLPENEPQPVSPVGAGTAPTAGVESLTVASALADDALAENGLSSPIPTGCLAAVTGWSDQLDAELDSQQVFLEVATLTGQITDAIDELELATDIDRWQSYRAFIGLSYQLQRAGEAFTSDSVHLLTITIDHARPLLAICTELYGPEAAMDMATKIAKSNRIRTPARVPAGTVLRVPAEAT